MADSGSIPGSGISPGEGNHNPLQYSCLENPMDRGARWATVLGVTRTEQQQMRNYNSFKKESNMIRFVFWESHSGFRVENRLVEGRLG